MKELTGVDLWEVPADLRVITTNGAVRKADGACVMGRGCAREARERLPGIDLKLGRLIKEHGNRVMRLGRLPDGSHLASYPVKRHWKEAADPDLIVRSAHQLVELAQNFGYTRVAIPRPGSGNGRLRWTDVRALIAPILDDRFTAVHGGDGSPTTNEEEEDADGEHSRERYLFFGSRSWDEATPIRERLAALPQGATVVTGGARGADRIAGQIARRMGLRVEVHPAHWDEEGKAAGFRRNERMAALPNLRAAYGFRVPGTSNGTDHMARLCRQAGIPTSVQLPAKSFHLPVSSRTASTAPPGR
jgi:hypothetical protein